MRVIGGRFGGRKLVGFDEDHIRPTSDRVKESLFNILRHEIDLQPDMDHEVVVLDLFSGTGNLAFEALSRGAKHVVCVEKSKRSIEIIKKNRSGLEVSNSQCQIVQKDVFVFLKAGTKNLEIEKPFDIIETENTLLVANLGFGLTDSVILKPDTCAFCLHVD